MKYSLINRLFKFLFIPGEICIFAGATAFGFLRGTETFNTPAAVSLFIFATLVHILFFLYSVFIIRRIISIPVRQIAVKIGELNSGKGDLSEKIPFHGDDEIGTAVQEVNTFLDRFNILLLRMRSIEEFGRTIGNTIEDKSNTVVSAIEEISRTITSLRQKFEHLNHDIEKSHQDILHIHTHTDNVVHLITNQSSAMIQSSSAVEESNATISSITERMQQNSQSITQLVGIGEMGRNDMEQTLEESREIRTSVDTINDMAQAIHDISDNTNILSMNAAIEAAHAGEAGRGFAVVAEEIKHLAESSGVTSQEITGILNKITIQISNLSSIAEKTEHSLHSLLENINTISENTQEISGGMVKISGGSREISTSITDLKGITEEVRSSADQINNNILTIKEFMKSVESLSEENLGSITEVSDSIHYISSDVNELNQLQQTNIDNLDDLHKEIYNYTTAPLIVTENLVPYNYQKDEKPTGISTKILLHLMDRIDMHWPIEFMPWSMAYNIALEQPNILLYSMLRIKERENQFQWVGPLFTERMFVYRYKDRHDVKALNLSELQEYTVSAIRNNYDSQYLLRNGFIDKKNLISVDTQEENIRNLINGKVDAISITGSQFKWQIKSMGLETTDLVPLFELNDISNDIYIAFSLKTPKDIVRHMQSALDEYKASKEYARNMFGTV